MARNSFRGRTSDVISSRFLCKFLIAAMLFLHIAGCSTVGRKMSSAEPSVTSLGNKQFAITYYSQSLPEAASKLKSVASQACKGRYYTTDEYKVDDWRPVYVAVQARISCK